MRLGIEVDHQHLVAFDARAAARFTVDVVLPTPPFWLSTAIRRIINSSLNVYVSSWPFGPVSSSTAAGDSFDDFAESATADRHGILIRMPPRA